ncbi:MAG: FtsX-like permease family protein [Bacteroidota bacterium]
MISKLLQHSLRTLKRQKVYVLINVGGLAIGIACSLVIGLFVYQQLSVDQYHENKDNIYQLVLHGRMGGEEFTGAFTAAPIGPAMAREIPGLQGFMRMSSFNETVIRYEDNFFIEDHFIEADSTFFDFFSISLLKGNKQHVLNEPYTVVLSQSMAQRMFGNEDPINKMIRVGTGTSLYRVTGIMEDVPENTHFKANAVGSFMTNSRANHPSWLSNSFSTFVMLHPDAQPQQINEGIEELVLKYVGPQVKEFFGIHLEDFINQGNRYSIYLQPLTDIYLNPAVEQELTTPRDPRYLNIFAAIGGLILIIGAINFMNLSTAQATKRAREVGVKKVTGSSRGLLMAQFLTETIFLALLAMMLAVLLAELALPFLNPLLDIKLTINYFSPWYTIPVLLLSAIVIGILAGIYPAFYLSSFNPIKVLKGRIKKGNDLLTLRRVLTTLQFAISVILIIGTLIMHRQINFMLNKDLGFDKEEVVVIRRAGVLGEQINSFKNEMLTLPGVVSAAASTAVPGHENNNNGHMIKGRPEETFILQTNWVDYDYLETYGLEIDQGRFFDPQFMTDRQACLINQQAVKNFAMDDPLAIRFMDGDSSQPEMPVIGVVKDFHFESLHSKIRPYILKFKNEDMNWGYLSVRLKPGSPQATLEQINDIWASYTQQEPMLYFFLDEELQRLYGEEKQNARLSLIFTALAIVIASLGLFGLTAFTVAQKTREIGIRKTFGASKLDIWFMVAKEILILIAISTAIGWPLIYWIAENWLQNYHYRISLNPMDFFQGLIIATLIALTTISYRTLKAASINPSLSLRYE